ncbi:MAG: M48 family metallopeptidase [Gammaproteobacteria bacterium]
MFNNKRRDGLLENSLFYVDDDPALKVTFRRSARAKKVRIVVSNDKIEAIAPQGISADRVIAFVKTQRAWLKNAVQSVRERKSSIKPLSPACYTEGVSIPYRGKAVPLKLYPSSGKRPRVKLTTDPLFIVHMPDCLNEQRSERIRSALETFMKQKAKEFALQLIEKHGPRHELYPSGLRIKTLKSRWGSCGPSNNINLNWLLMLAPPIVFEYVVVHELCHIKHKNHSNDFWQLVGEHVPDYLEHRRWLKQHGGSLMAGL